MITFIRCTALAVILGFATAIAIGAEETKKPLRVAISPFAPFVIMDGKPRGYSIDIWEAIAEAEKLDFRYIKEISVKEKLRSLVQYGKADVAVGGITITEDREESVDFSHTTFKSGLDIMVLEKGEISLMKTIKSLSSGPTARIALAFLILVLVSAHLMWLVERGRDNFNDKYWIGVPEAVYWAIVTASTVGYGDKAPGKPLGRALACLMIIVALPMFCLFTAELTSSFTLQAIGSDIRGPDDLSGRRVGVVAGTTSEEWAREDARCIVIDCADIKQATLLLTSGDVDAVVYDRPNLKYHAKSNPKVAVVGKVFGSQDLGFAFRPGDPLREKVNRALLKIRESGEAERIRKKWFD